MKKLFFLFFFLFVVVITAQEEKKSIIFASKEEAIESYNIGTFQYFIPTYLSGYKKLSKKETIISFSKDATIRMDSVGKNYWTIQKAGTKFVLVNGKIIRRWDYGNKILEVYFLTPPLQKIRKKSPEPKAQVKKLLQEIKKR